MSDFLVTMDIAFPEGMPLVQRRALLAAEKDACHPFMAAGQFQRAWRSWGEHEGSHGHVALWSAASMEVVLDAYGTFPLVKQGYTRNFTVQPLQANPNDPGPHGENLITEATIPLIALGSFPLTFANLRRFLDVTGKPANQMGEGMTAEVIPGVLAVHDHPQSGRPRELHVMIADPAGLPDRGDATASEASRAHWQKIAEIGPPDGDAGEVGPGYINFLAEWAGRPVHHEEWKRRILADNNLLHDSYEAAVAAPRVKR